MTRLILAAAALALGACQGQPAGPPAEASDNQADDQGAEEAAPAGNAAREILAGAPNPNGAHIYARTCIACHGRDGKGAIPGAPDLTAADGRLSKPDSVLLRNMTNGFRSPGSPMAMPPRGGNPSLSDRDMSDVLAYLRATFGRQGP